MSDPIAIIREACERIKNSTGETRPNVIVIPAWIPVRIRESMRAKIANAERMLGIGCDPEGKFLTGWPWTKRAGRPSKEEKRLRDCLPGWRSLLNGLEEPERVSNGGRIHVLSARDTEYTAQTMAVLHRHPDGQEITRMTQVIGMTNPDVPAGHVAPMFCISDRTSAGLRGGGKTMIAMHERTYEECRRMDAAVREWRAANRRPTGKRAQRRAGKEWNR